MNISEIERLIAQINWPYIPANIVGQNGLRFSLFLRQPTSKEQAKSSIIYNTEYNNATFKGLLNEKDSISKMIILGRWTDKKENEIFGLRDDIHKIRRSLLGYLFNKTNLEKARSLLRRAEQALIQRLDQRQMLLQNSAESYALNCQQRYIICCITELDDGNRFWLNKNDFDQFNDIYMIIQLCDIFFKTSNISIKTIRKIARSQPWRAYWEIAKNTGNLFADNILSWSQNQRELAYWSTIYDSVYGAYERPSLEVINDDDLLDSWFIHQNEKIEQRTKSQKDNKPNKPGRNEQFIFTDREGAKVVYDMNDSNTRAKIQARQKILKKKGIIREQDMPDSQAEMRQQLMEKRNQHIKDISHR